MFLKLKTIEHKNIKEGLEDPQNLKFPQRAYPQPQFDGKTL